MPGDFYDIDRLENQKSELQNRNAAIDLQISELNAEKTSNTASIGNIDSLLAYISAGYPAITQLGTPANLTATPSAAAGVYTVALNWDDVATATGYIVERATNPDYTDAEEIYNDATSTYTDDDEDLTYNRQYYYRVKAIAAGKQDSEWAEVVASIFQQLDTPANVLLGNVAGSGEVTGTWDEVLYAQEYKVWRNTADDFNIATMIIEDLLTPEFTDNTVVNDTEYWYWITAHANNLLTSDAGAGGSITPAA